MYHMSHLNSGGRSGMLDLHDLRQKLPLVSMLPLHCQELCGLAVSPKGYLLATGGNDNTVNIIDLRKLPPYQPNVPSSNGFSLVIIIHTSVSYHSVVSTVFDEYDDNRVIVSYDYSFR